MKTGMTTSEKPDKQTGMKALIFGAGNIGRSFIGQIFVRAGWETVFVDLNQTVIDGLNERGHYPVIIKHPDGEDETRQVGPVRAILASDTEALTQEIISADMLVTSVGQGALPHVIASWVQERKDRAIDLILAENAREAVSICKNTLHGVHCCPVGFVESSIGKMVPLMRAEDLADDPCNYLLKPTKL